MYMCVYVCVTGVSFDRGIVHSCILHPFLSTAPAQSCPSEPLGEGEEEVEQEATACCCAVQNVHTVQGRKGVFACGYGCVCRCVCVVKVCVCMFMYV